VIQIHVYCHGVLFIYLIPQYVCTSEWNFDINFGLEYWFSRTTVFKHSKPGKEANFKDMNS
jgi:hypothetical protein